METHIILYDSKFKKKRNTQILSKVSKYRRFNNIDVKLKCQYS